jgi:transcriptional regulator with XRE-family HTH domain
MTLPAQLRAARVMLGLSQAEVAARASLSVPTIKRAEADTGIRVSEDVRAAIRSVLEASGIEFTDGEAPGVRLRRKKRK